MMHGLPEKASSLKRKLSADSTGLKQDGATPMDAIMSQIRKLRYENRELRDLIEQKPKSLLDSVQKGLSNRHSSSKSYRGVLHHNRTADLVR